MTTYAMPLADLDNELKAIFKKKDCTVKFDDRRNFVGKRKQHAPATHAPLLRPKSIAALLTPLLTPCCGVAVDVVLNDGKETLVHLMMDTCGPAHSSFCQLKCWVDY